jgi:uncharacterized Tic20 family protein
MGKNIVKTIFVIIACLGDEISDVLYLYQNWDSFANNNIRNASIAFLAMPFIICFVLGFILMFKSNGLSNCSCGQIIVIGCFCGWIPLTLICTFLIWTKILSLLDFCDWTSKVTDDKSFVKTINKFSVHMELFFEDIPQLIIQVVNNQLTKNWDLIAYISLFFTVVILLYELIKFLFLKDEDETVHVEGDSEINISPRIEVSRGRINLSPIKQPTYLPSINYPTNNNYPSFFPPPPSFFPPPPPPTMSNYYRSSGGYCPTIYL